MKNKIILFIVVLLLLSGCSDVSDGQDTVQNCSATSTLLLNEAGLENTYNKIIYDELQKYYEQFDSSISCFSAVSITDNKYETILRAQSENGSDFVVLFGEEFAESLAEVSEDLFNTKYIYFDGNGEFSNVYNITFSEYQLGFLAGIASAVSAETNERSDFLYIASASDNLEGYEGYNNAILSNNPEANVILLQQSSDEKQSLEDLIKDVYTNNQIYTTYAPSFSDNQTLVNKVTEINNTYQSYLIGYGYDHYRSQFSEEDSTIYLTSVIKNYAYALETFINKYLDDSIQGGNLHPYDFGVLNEGISLELGVNTNFTIEEIDEINKQVDKAKNIITKATEETNDEE